MKKGGKAVTAIVAVIVIAIAAYSLFPYVASTNAKDLKSGQTAYIYGTVEGRVSLGNFSAFSLNYSSGALTVIWNFTLPAHGEKVLVYGKYEQYSILFSNVSVFDAASVTDWPF
jgi:hypothetical protein